MNTRIRFHQAKDMPTINAICNECWLTYYPHLVGNQKVNAVMQKQLQKPREFKESNATQFVFVATLKRKVVGYAVCRIQKKIGTILALYVKPSKTNQGIGTMLLKRSFRELKKRGCTQAKIETLLKNKLAQELYERTGFQKIRVKFHAARGIPFRVWELKKRLD